MLLDKLTGFNGATTQWSWKWTSSTADTDAADDASMGPRRSGRGSGLPGGSQAIAPERLQWGHDAVVVEVSSATLVTATRTMRASMGPRRSGRGSAAAWTTRRSRASFNGATTQWSWKWPRRAGAGSPWTLQWGHDAVVVEVDDRGSTHGRRRSGFNGATTQWSWK